MKTCFLLIVFGLTCIIGNAQVVAIQNHRGIRLIMCVNNSLKIAVEGLSYKDISVSTNNGIISKDKYKGPGHYGISPDTYGTAYIYIKKRTGKDAGRIIDSVGFIVERIPAAAYFAWKTGGSLSHAQIVSQRGISVPIYNVDISGNFPIHSYAVIVYRNGKEIFRREIKGQLFDALVTDFLHKLHSEDQLKFTDVKITDCDTTIRTLDPISILVTDAVEYEKVREPDTISIEDPMTGEMFKISDSIWRRNK